MDLRRAPVVLVAALLGLCGCSGTGAEVAATASRTPPPGATGSAASPVPAAPPTGPALSPVPARSVAVVPAVPLRSPAGFGNGVTARVVSTEAVTSAGSGPGQVAGRPALAVTLSLANRSASAVPLQAAVATASWGAAGTPGVPVDGPPARPFSGSVPPGGEATGVYVFAVPPEGRSAVTVSLSYGVDTPTVVFAGAAG